MRNALTAPGQPQMRSKWTTETGGNLSNAVQESIDKINASNIAGFLFRNSMKDTFYSALDEDWLFLKIIRSIENPANVALLLEGDATQWEKDKWDDKYCNMPPFIPESEEIEQMRENLKYVTPKGHMFVDDEEKRHFILDDAYKNLFKPDLWRKKKDNDAVYMALIARDGLEKQKFKNKTNDYLFEV